MSRKQVFQFLDIPREMPAKKPLELRLAGDWSELYGGYTPDTAAAQAGRCLDCGNPYCQVKCPLHNFIPEWLRLLDEGRLFDAAERCHETNPLPEICGRVCPQDRLCEGACTLNDGFGAVSIGAAEKAIADRALGDGWRPDLSRVGATGKRVAVIGAGPAGLSCADRLAHAGIHARVFDRYEDIGGLLRYGIPAFKLEKRVLDLRREVLEGMGIEFRLGVEVGRDIAIGQLLEDFDAVFIGTGAYRYTDGGLPGQELRGVLPALPFLIGHGREVEGVPGAAARPVAGWEHTLALPAVRGKRVVVLGGGDTGMDCVRASVRLGAAEVTCVYRRDEASMPGSAREVANAREEGVRFLFNRQPLEILGDADGRASGVRMAQTEPGPANTAGRRGARIIEGNETVLDADIVLIAFGFSPELPTWLGEASVDAQADGRIRVGPDAVPRALPFQTTHPRLFAGGDAVRGADLVVTAVAEGRDAAAAIARFLGDKPAVAG
ncbi:glutamate synthase small subunit [Lysobacter pythonis]|uniref:Glutamate synthase small subunit n=1 Tax=Solilutibacter pythonis TaxID=2483112 RepID=A0A3M2HM82_9GAMM|nr:FAD-dependent oxidoreductase [Lysobacter pythonis]RMH88993.1 glutamate synthase small subunit [Lysobacter pythonis]